MNPHGSKVLIAGAGIGGLTAAMALKQAGFEVQVLERAKDIQALGAGITLQMNATAALDRLGLMESIVAQGNLLTQGEVRYAGRTLATVSFGEISQELGHPCVAIHRGRLQAVLLDALGRDRVATGVEVTHAEQTEQGVRIPLPQGGYAEADLLIGADGVRSQVRKSLWGDEPLRPSGYSAWRGVCRNPGLWPANLAVETWGDGQLFGAMPINAEQVYWFATKMTAPGECKSDDPRAEILRRFEGWPDSIPALIAATPGEDVLVNEIFDRPPRFPWGRGRITLLGDAIHPMTPNLGQGGGQAVEDAVVLAHDLARAEDVEQGLRAYEARRHPRTRKFMNHSRMFTALAHGQYLWARVARRTVFPWIPQGLKKRQMLALYRFEL